MGRGTLRLTGILTSWLTTLTPAALQRGFFLSLLTREVGAGKKMGKVLAFGQVGGRASERVAQLQALMGAVVA